MRIELRNRLDCTLDAWSTPAELAHAILSGELVLMDGDRIIIEGDTEGGRKSSDAYAD